MDQGISDFEREILRTLMIRSSRRPSARDGHAEATVADLPVGELFAEIAHSSVNASNGSGASGLIPVNQAATRRLDVEKERRTLSRAIARLWRHGLVRLRRALASGDIRIELTEAGVEEAR
jgi:hypothetical protein